MNAEQAAIYLNGYNAAKREGEERLDRATAYAAELIMKSEQEKEQLASELETVRGLLKSTTVEQEKQRKKIDISVNKLARQLLKGQSPCAFCTQPCASEPPFRDRSLYPIRAICDKNSKFYMFEYKSES